ncbi:MAG: eukaryotic-like serine/threonine-protein kinase [Verrucomicrobiota bacterium]|jgi:serine/threonine-protein kinase
MDPRHFFSELQRRNVYKVAVAYAVAAWLLIQIATQTFPFFEIPNWIVRAIILLLLLGFPIALVFAWIYELTPEGLKRTEEVPPNESIRRKTGRRLMATAGVVAALALALLLFRFARSTPTRPDIGTGLPPPMAALASGIIPEKSIAILPFQALSLQTRDEILEAGMADTLIAKLSATREIIIPSLTSARKYAEQEHDPLAAGRLLHVKSVLEGTFQKLGDRIRVTARLMNVADGASLWTGSFDEKFTDVFAVQDAIAQKVAAALALRLTGEKQASLTKRYTENTEAYQLYLKGRFFWAKYTEEGFRKAIDHFNQALEKDPTYALAYTGLADSYSIMADQAFAAPKEAYAMARAYAETALKLDDNLSDAHLSLGIVKLLYDADLKQAEEELRRAKDLNPSNAQAYHFYAHYLQVTERLDDGLAEMRRGAQLDPTSFVISAEVGFAYFFAHKFEEAIGQSRKILELDPDAVAAHTLSAVCYLHLGKYDQVRAELDKVKPPAATDTWIRGFYAALDAKEGKRDEARRITEDLAQKGGDPWPIAVLYTFLGDKDQAFAALNRVREYNRAQLLWVKIDPSLDPLRSDPRWPELFRRAGLEPPQRPP